MHNEVGSPRRRAVDDPVLLRRLAELILANRRERAERAAAAAATDNDWRVKGLAGRAMSPSPELVAGDQVDGKDRDTSVPGPQT